MKNKSILISIFLLLMLNFSGLFMFSFIKPVSASPLPLTSLGPNPIDVTVDMLGEDEIAARKYAAEFGHGPETGVVPYGEVATIGEGFTVTVGDFGLNIDYDQEFVVIMDGIHGIICIEKEAYDNYDAVNDEYVFPNPNGCWRPEDRVSTAMLTYLLDEFDYNIYPTDTRVYGEPLPRGEEGQKVWILIHNIRDESYYDCDQDTYVAGYFSAAEDAENNKNMFHMDTYDWQNRVGPDAARPYLYEGTFAHEFQHLIHNDIDPDEETWVDEGCADMAQFLCGYGHSESHLAYYMVYHPFTSLTFWGSGLEDYGAVYLFMLYMYEHYGGERFMSTLIAEDADGIDGVENALHTLKYRRATFDQIFDDWTVANYLDADHKCGGKYGYKNLEIGSIDTWGYTIEYALNSMWWGPPDEVPFEIPSYWFGDPQPYTAQYYRFTNEKFGYLELVGDKFAGVTPFSGTYEWYSGAEIWGWRSFSQSFDIPAGGATLNFMTYFEIEDDWDYGYVEVYDQDTGEWYTLDAAGTVDYVAHDQVNPNVPAGREPTDYAAAGRWHAFTGNSGGWIPVSMDLTPFAGHSIDLYFRTWQDGAFTLQMMYVDDISITELGFSDDVESGEDGWTPDGWYISDGKFPNDWGLTLINTKGVPTERYPEDEDGNVIHGKLHWRMNMWMWDCTDIQYGFMFIGSNPVNSGRTNVAIITNHAYHIINSGYVFSSALLHFKWHCFRW